MKTPLHVLIVEDSDDDTALIVRTLRQGGYEPVWARVSSSSTMTQALDREDCDLVVADHNLPGFSSLAALALINARGLDVPFIIVSGAIGEELAVQAMKAGAHDYVMKHNLARLVPAIERELRDAQERRARGQAEEALRLAEAKYRSIVENAVEGIFQTTPHGRYVSANPALARMYGHSSPEELLASITDIEHQLYVDPSRRAEFRRRMKEHGIVRGFESQVYRKDGSTIWISEYARAVRDGSGAVVAYEGFVQDISERKAAEDKLALYREIVANSIDGIAILDLNGDYLEQNSAHGKLIGFSDDELRGKSPGLHLGDEVFAGIAHELATKGYYRGEVTSRTKTGTVVSLELSAFTIKNPAGESVCHVGIKRDITERKRAEEQLRSTLDRLRTVSGRLEVVREEERARIARELHDELGVGLTCIKIDLSRLSTMMAQASTLSDRVQVDDKIRSMMEFIDRTIVAVQRIVTELRPPVLDDLGLVAAIEWQAQDFQRRTGITCSCTASQEDIQVEPERATAVFRICQEALTNVARHARATEVKISLEENAGSLLLVVRDNGHGIPEEKLSDPQSLGLLGMRERAALFGGHLNIEGCPGQGTMIALHVPGAQPT